MIHEKNENFRQSSKKEFEQIKKYNINFYEEEYISLIITNNYNNYQIKMFQNVLKYSSISVCEVFCLTSYSYRFYDVSTLFNGHSPLFR